MTEPTTREIIGRALMRLGNNVHTFGKDPTGAIRDYVDQLTTYGPYGVEAVEVWPLQSSTWPSLKEITDLAKDLQHRARMASAASQGHGGTPVAKFIAAVLRSERGGPGYVRSWLDGSTYPILGATVIRTTALGVERLTQNFGELAESLGVKFSYDRAADERLIRFNEDLRAAGKFEPEKRRARP